MFIERSLAWFESKVDQVVYRNNRPFPINSPEDARYCHDLQREGFKFSLTAEGAKPRVHVSGGSCISCEG